MHESASLQIQPPALPKGGGTLNGMGESLAAAGLDGATTFTVPLPASSGRGFAPKWRCPTAVRQETVSLAWAGRATCPRSAYVPQRRAALCR